ncbi:diphosphomevalonate decarboxylase [Leptopilina heterotoma]|uniref:diphosphomevalonate decarboxylase n=1 Tax=Leptopilina heterotoma TaxID=63436 RepID=UPI001CA87561|nr:diphosphomevalonate decarboxylase [Leptopilina heterotoma]
MSTITCIAPVNIAVIKYWGKRDENLILPINDSISATLDTEQLCAKTTIMASPDFKKDQIWLNGKEETINKRLQNCLQEMKKRAQVENDVLQWKIHICSENNFPTAAGLASSAAGYACFATALAKLYKVEGDVSAVARAGSGSACRSTMGGFVRWHMGSDPKGSDSTARQIAPADHWPEMRILILVVKDDRKKVSSAEGMKRSVETSELLKYRAECIVPKVAKQMEKVILEKNFEQFALLTMKDSNQFHAICRDTYPPCAYMNDISQLAIELVHAYNSAVNETRVAYTFDAGPNPTLYLLQKDVPEFSAILNHYFPPPNDADVEYKKGIPVSAVKLSEDLLKKMTVKPQLPGLFKYTIHTRVGEGPKILKNEENHLLNNHGLPIKGFKTD